MVGRYRLPFLVVAALVLSGCTAPGEPDDAMESPAITIDGALPANVKGFNAGPRFLKQVEWPDHIANPPTISAEDEKPGDGYDDGLLVTKRRHTDRSFYEKEWTPRLTLSGVHGTPSNPICLCDAEFVFENANGRSPKPSVEILSSSWILVDNITLYGGFIAARGGHNVTFTRSIFIASEGIGLTEDVQDVTVIDNDFIGHLGPAYPHSNPPAGLNECWPDPPSCWAGGVGVVNADRVTITHNYFDGADSNGVATSARLFKNKIIHNTFYNGARMEIQDEGQISWNLARGWASALMMIGGPGGRVENNSIILTTKANPFELVLAQPTGLEINVCDACIVKNNDFVGFGYGYQGEAGAPAMTSFKGSFDASDNYWGTLHDPRLPPDTIIWNIGGMSTITINGWDLAPNHDLDPIVVSPYPDDVDYWLEKVLP